MVQTLNDVLAQEGNLLPELYENSIEVNDLGVEIRETNDIFKRPQFNNKGKPTVKYVYKDTSVQYGRYRFLQDIQKKYYYFMKTLYLMSKYKTYDEYVQAQGDHPKIKKLWDFNQKAFESISEIVEDIIDLNITEENKYDQIDFNDDRLEKIYSKSDYAAEEAKYEKTLVDVQNIAGDCLTSMYMIFFAPDNTEYPAVLSNERSYVLSNVHEYLSIYPHIDTIRNIASMLVGSEDLQDTYDFEAKIKYEIDKYDLCNNHGITPKSYDAFMHKVQYDMDLYIRSNPDFVINHPEQMEELRLRIYKENKDLLKKVPDFEKDYKSQGKIIYSSAFLIKYINAEMRFEEEIKESINKVDPRTQTAVTKMYQSLIDYQNRRFDRLLGDQQESNDSVEEEIQTSQAVKSKQNDIQKLLAERNRLKAETEKKKKEAKEASNKEVEVIKEELPTMKEVVKEVETPKIENTAKMPEIAHNADESSQKSIHPHSEASYGISEGVSEQGVELKNSEFDEFFKQIKQAADPKILRDTNIPFSIRRLKYIESSKYSRSLFLPNSGYRVTVNKLKDEAKLSYMINLVNDIYTAEANYMVKSEMLMIVYSSLSFDDFVSPPSYEVFLDNLHDSDLSILFAMFALVNAPDSYNLNGDITFNANNFHCKECGTTLYSKNPISFNLKNEFLKIYDRAKFSEKFPKYQAGIPYRIDSIYQENIGKLHTIELNDYISQIIYKFTYRLPSVAIELEIDRTKYSLSYTIMKKELSDRIDSNIQVTDADIKTFDYINSKSYNDLIDRYQDLSKVDFEDETYKLLTGDNKLEFDRMKEEYLLVERIVQSLSLITNRLSRLYTLMRYIYNIAVFVDDPEIGLVAIEVITIDDLAKVVECLSNLSEESLQKLINAIDKLNESNVYNQDIEVHNNQLIGKLEWNKYFQSIDGKVVSEDDYLQNILTENPNADLEIIKETREERKNNLENGYCVCGHSPLTLNYTQLLFFCLSKSLEVIH